MSVNEIVMCVIVVITGIAMIAMSYRKEIKR